MNHDKATEEFFRLRGWRKFKSTSFDLKYQFYMGGQDVWIESEDLSNVKEGDTYYIDLPKICESMTDWIKYVAEFMEGEGLRLCSNFNSVSWNYFHGNTGGVDVLLKDHQILYASVLAANEYLKGRQNDKS